MIRVIVHPDKYPIVEEFFELFKTEWAPYDPGQPCTVLLTDGSAPSDVKANLLILYSSIASPDEKISRPAKIPEHGFCLTRLPNEEELPLYHALRRFNKKGNSLITEVNTGDTIAYSNVHSGVKIIRVGYDLFDEVDYLLTVGQPPENAGIPTLDRHIDFLRQSILAAGFPVIEIPPAPPGHDFMVCLTHDVDFVSIRSYGLDHTTLGFIYRASFGSIQRYLRHRLTPLQLLKNWNAALSLPLVHAGLCQDFWMQFETYRKIEGTFRSTFFLIPYPEQAGNNLSASHPERRAARYDLESIQNEVSSMQNAGWEFGLHGIDAWHDAHCATQEKARLTSILREPCAGTRTHWLYRNKESEEILDTAKFEYDSTNGYNETVGFKNGTSQVFKPLHATHLLEVPLHIQDVALFYPAFLDLDDSTAWQRCMVILEHQKKQGGVLTILWHMRSLAPERLWGNFYKRLLNECSSTNAWIGTARKTADWFNARRQMKLTTSIAPEGRLSICATSENKANPEKMTIRVYQPKPYAPEVQLSFTDTVWSGQSELRIPVRMKAVSDLQEVPA